MEALVTWFMSHLGQYVSREALVFIISMIPLIELRGGILASVLLEIPMGKAVGLCVCGNIIPVPFILFFVKKIFAWMKKTRIFRGFVEKMENKALKNKDKVQRYELWGLALFVGIPIPGTGAWTGSLVAALFDMNLKKAIIAILLGLCLSTVIMTLFSYGFLGTVLR